LRARNTAPINRAIAKMITSETTTKAIQQRLRRFAPAACGETVAKAKADRVYRVAMSWQRSVTATRARAAR
jgi:hypothetical protein